MELDLNGKRFTLRCDMLALRDADQESGIKLGDMDEDVVQLGTLAFYMARSGAKFSEVPFNYDLDTFLSLISWGDLAKLSQAIGATMAIDDGGEKKK